MGAPLTPQQIQMQRLRRIQETKHQFENNDGLSIKTDKIQEWTLLDIAESLGVIKDHLQDIRGNVYIMMKNDTSRGPGR